MDNVNQPKHYNSHPSGVECIEVAKFHCFCLGNAIKYIWRAGLKSDDPVEDLQKAIWYLNKKVQMYEQAGEFSGDEVRHVDCGRPPWG